MSGEKNLTFSFSEGMRLAADIFAAEVRRVFVSFNIFSLKSNSHHTKNFASFFFF